MSQTQTQVKTKTITAVALVILSVAGMAALALVSVTSNKTVSNNTVIPTPIATPAIVMGSPNGGETWELGKSYTISWKSTNAPANSIVNLVLTDWDKSLSSRIGENLPASGSFTWTVVQATPGSKFKISANLVDGARGVVAEDQSNNYFSIAAAGTGVSVVSPNGGENYKIGMNITVQYKASFPDIQKVDFGYLSSRTGKIVWFENGQQSNGIYNWIIDIGKNNEEQTKFCVKKSTDSNSTRPIQDCSDNYFTISPNNQYVKIIAPNGGEKLTAGRPYTIKWNYDKTDKVNLKYSCANGSGNYFAEQVINTGSYVWNVNTNGQSKCKIIIEGWAGGVGMFTDVSDNYFTVGSQ
jgi:hypothetical protein